MIFRESLPTRRGLTTQAGGLKGFLLILACQFGVDGTATRLAAQDSKVSFAADVAPIFLEHCKGCHLGGQQASGGLRLDSFRQLSRGGNSGEIFQPGKATESLLVRKLKGEAPGRRMPSGGRPALSTEQIDRIAGWIDAGANFDGASPDTNLATVAQSAWASSASQSEIFELRKAKARERFQKVLPNDEPGFRGNDELFMIGNTSRERLQEIESEFQNAVATVKKQAKIPADQALVRGGLVLFVFDSRYDYSEFGRMNEKRELPKDWTGHWRADSVDAYLVLSDSSSPDIPLNARALHLVTGVFWGSLPEVPYWFAEGMARHQLAIQYRKKDLRVNQWLAEVPSLGRKINSSSSLTEGTLDEETIGLMGMAMVESMMSRASRPKCLALMNHLLKGSSFPDAMARTFGKPDEFVQAWLGK